MLDALKDRKAHRFPRNALHDLLFTAAQVLDHVVLQSGLRLDETFYHFVDVKGVKLEDVQDPGEAQVRFGRFAAAILQGIS